MNKTLDTKRRADDALSRGISRAKDSSPAARCDLWPSFEQPLLWHGDSVDPGLNPTQRLQTALRFNIEPDRPALLAALNHVISRHGMIPAHHDSEKSDAQESTTDGTPVSVVEHDLSSLDKITRDGSQANLIAGDANAPFAISAPPLVRFLLLKLAETDYWLILTAHSTFADEFSLRLMASEITTLYTAALRHDSDLPNLPAMQYAEYSKRHELWLRTKEGEQQHSFWKDQLADMPQPTAFPSDRIPQATSSYAAGSLSQTLSSQLTAKLHALSSKHDVGVSSVMLAAWSALLSRMTNQNDLAIGIRVANSDPRLQGTLIGPYARWVPLRLKLDTNGQFASLLGQVDEVFSLLQNQTSISYESLAPIDVNTLRPRVGFEFRETANIAAPECNSSEPYITEIEPKKMSLAVSAKVILSTDRLEISLIYAKELYDRSTIERLSGHWQALLQAVAYNAETSVAKLPVLTEAQNQHVLKDLSCSRATHRINSSIHSLFERQVQLHRDASALVFGDQSLTYDELNARANRVAHKLIDLGVSPNDRVVICVRRGIEMIVALLGVLKAGGAYVPVDPNNPVERLQYLLRDSTPKALLTSRSLRDAAHQWLPATHPVELLLDEVDIEESRIHNPVVEGFSPRNLAYVIYTSGSTGEPKGVMVEHRQFTRLLLATAGTFHFSEADIWAQFHSIAFDVSAWEVWGALLHGGRLVVVSEECSRNPSDLYDLLAREHVTVLCQTPSAFRGLSAAQEQSIKTHRLRLIIFAGEALTFSSLSDWVVRNPLSRTNLVNMYGPTEATVYATIKLIGDQDIRQPRGSNIGRPLSDVSIYILDDQSAPVPIGVTGELYIGGDGIARGYMNRADLSAERFISDPFSTLPETRLYKSGDLARWLPDGDIEYLGRNDHQVKIRGFRIELGEVEARFLSSGLVQDVIIDAQGFPTGDDKRLVAYIVPSSTATSRMSFRAQDTQDSAVKRKYITELSHHLRQALPDYMIPTSYVVLCQFPLNLNGKVDRDALASLTGDTAVQSELIAPRTEKERILCNIWKSILRVEQIGIRDNFYVLGGDSILAILVSTRARSHNLKLSVRDLFQHQTIEDLAKCAENTKELIPQEPSVGEMPMLPIHERFFLHDTGNLHHYHQSRVLTVPDGFSLKFLREAIRALYLHHDALRLRYRHIDGRWSAHFEAFQGSMVGATVGYEARATNAGTDMTGDLGGASRRAREAINIESGPLFRALFFTAMDPADRCLLLVFHHLVIDGVSWRILLQDLTTAYEQWSKGQPIDLGVKTTSYQDWAHAVVRHRESQIITSERDYWLASWAIDVPKLPQRDLSADVSREKSTRIQTMRWSKEETAALLSRCNTAYGTEINELLLSALLLAVRRWAGHSTIRVGMEGHGREVTALASDSTPYCEADLTAALGWFTSYYPLVLSIPQQADELHSLPINELIKAVKEACRAVPRRGIGYGISRFVSKDETLRQLESHAPIEIVFNYLGQFENRLGENAQFSVTSDDAADDISPDRPREHLIGLNGAVSDQHLSFWLDYDPSKLANDNAQRLAEAYITALSEIVDHCQRHEAREFSPSDFPLAKLSQADINHWHALYPRLTNLYPATALQMGLIFHSLMDGMSDTYSNQLILSTTTSFDIETFRQAWSTIVERHSIFRTAIVGLQLEHPMQLVINKIDAAWQEMDNSQLDKNRAIEVFDDYRRAEKHRSFKFSHPGLMRFTVFRQPDHTYRFLWTYHHALLDGWSVGLVVDELTAIYETLRRNKNANLPPAIPYASYIRWLQHQDRDSAFSYWRRKLGGINEGFSIPFRQEGLEAGDTSQPIVFELSEARTRQLHEVARAHRVTLFTIVQAAWAVLLHQYTCNEDVVFGTVMSGRGIDLADADKIVGLLINTVPNTVTIEHARAVCDWLRSIQENHQNQEAHAHLSLGDIQRCSALPRGQSLFDSVLLLQNYQTKGPDRSSSTDFVEWKSEEETHYGITLTVSPAAQLHVEFGFDIRHYYQVDIRAMASKFGEILHRFCSTTSNTRVNYLTSHMANISQIVPGQIASNQRPSKMSRQGELRLGRYLPHQLVENQAERNPQNVALRFNDLTYTYDELNGSANRVANELLNHQHAGLRADSLVGVVLPRGDKLLVTILAIWKAGAAYIPIDSALPPERVHLMLRNADARLIVVDTAQESHYNYEQWGIPNVTYDELIKGRDDVNPDVNVSGHDLSYVLYTSGSTGTPKAVMVEHIGVLNNIINKVIDFEIGVDGRVAQTATQSFDISVWQMFIALTQGGTTVIYDDKTISNIDQLIRKIAIDQITVWELVPSYLVLVMELFEESALDASLSSLRFLVLTGEAADANYIRKWFQRFPDTKVVNAYGPTEASDDITHYIMTPQDTVDNPVPVGNVLANFDIYVVDENLNPLPIGQKGEIVVSGVGVARGYLNSVGVTNNSFIPNPFDDRYKGRLYKTGDIGQVREDGVLMFHGRKDKQVKVRGFRIELQEIEQKILESESIYQAVVEALTLPGRETFLCAYIVARGSQDAAELTSQLKTQLPHYMIPTEIQFLSELPILSNGKVDRATLKASYNRVTKDREYHPPVDEMEDRLCRIWGEVLKFDKVGVIDNFFEIGGDSFAAIRIAAKYGSQLEVSDIYNLETIRAIAGVIRTRSVATRQAIAHVAGRAESAKVAILGISNSGGDPISFRAVGTELVNLSNDFVTYAVKFPRTPVDDDDAMLAEIERLTAVVCDTVASTISLPIIIFAQCNGSALAISISRELEKRGTPVHSLCIGGALMRTIVSPRDLRTNREVIEFLRSIGSSLPDEPDEVAFFLSDFRYDIDFANSYYNKLLAELEQQAIELISSPIYCFAGTNDPLIVGFEQKYLDWKNFSLDVSLVEFKDVGHFLLRDCPKELAESISRVWQKDYARPAASQGNDATPTVPQKSLGV